MIFGIFPEPILATNINRPFTQKEKSFVESCSTKILTNELNCNSHNAHVLDHPDMEDIREFILSNVREFVKATELPKTEHEYYVTNSWFNYTNPGQGHHEHKHQNSFLTGVLYMNAVKSLDEIRFTNPKTRFIQLFTEEFNEYNSRDWEFKVGTGDLLIFRSELAHKVPFTDPHSKHTRISLAFNIFLRGHIGHEHRYTELNLK